MASPRTKFKSSRPRSSSLPGSKLIFSEAISSSDKAVEPVVAHVLRKIEEYVSLDGRSAPVEIALREALANAIVHGNRRNNRKRVELNCFLQADQSILLVVRDQGPGFDPASLPDPTQPENLFRAGGRGIYLIRHFMDDVEFRSGGSEIRMRKSR